ncbi:hypothetical protein HT136_05765 [Novosphingobium profundi]|uniref:hypothetical protein n=1 Tax=Novosphingobium profundi TaxID=1774954 RepID=UPI001BDA0CEE|nr:hypothetical protein [Novosphingobium profundi]MBT0667872.1 hypothetical protein [Novosphingobium profundi]
MRYDRWMTYVSAKALLLGLALSNHALAQDSMSADADARDTAVAACMKEAKVRGEKLGAVDVSMRKVEDTDKKDDGRAAVRAQVDVALRQKDGTTKIKKMTFKCETRHDVVTAFTYN